MLKRVMGNTGAQAVADIGGKLVLLLTYAVIARELGPTPLGEITFALSLSILLVIAGLGTDPLIAREVARDRATIPDLMWNIVGIKLILCSVGAAVIIVVAVFGEFDTNLRVTLILLAIAGVIDTTSATLAWVLRGLQDMVPVAITQIAQRLTLAVITIPAVLFLDGGVIVFSSAYLLASIVSGSLLVIQLIRRDVWGRPAFSPRRAWEIAVESLPLATGSALATVLARLDAILLAALSTLAVVGIYGAAYRVIESTFFVGWAFGLAIYPLLSTLSKDSTPTIGRVFAVASRVSLAGMLPAGAVFILFPAPPIELIYGSGFDAAIEPTRWLGIVAAVNGLASVAMFALIARDLKKAIVGVCLAALLVNLALNLALIPVYGATGAAIAMAAAYIVLAGASVVFASRDIGSISLGRVTALTMIAFGAMAVARVALGETWIAIVVGLVLYAAALILGHHQLFGDDTRLARAWLAERRSRSNEPLPES